MVLADFGLGAQDVVRVSCSDDPCVTPGGTVTAEVSIPVPVPGLGPVLGTTGPVSVSSAHAAPVDRYRAVPWTRPASAARAGSARRGGGCGDGGGAHPAPWR